MSSASEALETVAAAVGDAADATREGLTALSGITDEQSSDQVAVRLGAARHRFTSAVLSGERANTALDDARSAAQESEAQVLSRLVDDVQTDLELGLTALTSAVEDLEAEESAAARWGAATTAGRASTAGARGDDDLTRPSRAPDPHATPEGVAETAPRARADVQEALRYQNEAAFTLARAGYRVRRLPRSDTAPSPDFELEDRAFDCYTPRRDTSADAVRTKLRRKAGHQAARFVINLDRSRLDPAEIRLRLQANPPHGVREVLAVRNDTVLRIFPE
jgi:hypothetical protein